MELFLHPWYMIAGAVLVSSPILIHLINRMRFRRVRWAAMEFLLKSQKRNRRRLIIEQLILLALRIGLVLLAGFLVARFIGEVMAGQGQGNTHVVVIDDTFSMGDRNSEPNHPPTAFESAKKEVVRLAASAAEAPSPQQMRVLLLSDLGTVLFDQRLNAETVKRLEATLAPLKPTVLHVDPAQAVHKAREAFKSIPIGGKILHLVSDFRDNDWVSGSGVDRLNEELDGLPGEKIRLSLLDVGGPHRARGRQVALNHDNLALVDLRAETRVAAEGVPVEFVATLRNFGAEDRKSFLKVKVDGQEYFGAAQPIDRIPSGGTPTEVRFSVLFSKKRPAEEIKPGDTPEERERKRRQEREFFHVAAEILPEPTGLNADNVRDLVIEVRRKVPTLVVDGNGLEGRLPGGDLFHIVVAFAAARSYEVESASVDDLEKINLDLYPSVMFLNVPEIKNEKVLHKLDDYVRRGGNLCYFLGDKVKAPFYNDTLFKQHKGLFPILIGPRPYNPLDPNGLLSEEERQEKRNERRQRDPQPKILFKHPEQPVVATLALSKDVISTLRYLGIDRYYRALPRTQWDPTGRAVEELVSLPNNQSIDSYKGRAQELAARAVEKTREAAVENKDLQKYVEPLERYRREVTTALATPYLFNLVRALDALLKDPGVKDDPARPDMPTLWAQPGMKALAQQIAEFRETVLYGDPLVVARTHGKGRVVAVLTAAGTASRWNDWGGGSPASFSYQVFMMDLQRWLSSEGEDPNRLVGAALALRFNAARYQPKVRRTFEPQTDLDAQGEGKEKVGARPTVEKLGDQALPQVKDALTFDLADLRRPGVHTLGLFATGAPSGDSDPPTEELKYAFNIDAEAESDLKRASRDKLERKIGKEGLSAPVVLHVPGDDYEVYKERQPDASESAWLYLLFLIVLVVEQALAVHLSFHLHGHEAVAPVRPRPQTAAA